MRLHVGLPTKPVLAAAALLVLLLVVVAIIHPIVSTKGADAAPAQDSADLEPRDTARPVVPARLDEPAPPAPAALAGWSGFAFDACRAPSQRVMDRWRSTSPFTGVGIYLGGVHRACEQRHLNDRWVDRQLRSGWKLLPIWVGPQASCTGYDHRIVGRPGRDGRYASARMRGIREAGRAAAAARALRIPPREVVFYDIEPFDTRKAACRRSSLAFLEEWTKEIHRHGYRAGVYSHVKAGISLLSRTGPGYERPDAVWYAWIDRVGSMPREYVTDQAFMRTSRVHQYALDTRVEFGDIRMDIDWNFVSLGATGQASSPASCDDAAARIAPRTLGPGAKGAIVRVAQCLVLPGDPHPVKTSGQYDADTVRAVRAFQQRRGLDATGAIDRRTWTSLLARGGKPVLKKGSQGDAVRRLQRTLRVAMTHRRIAVDGAYGPSTARAVKQYRKHLGLPDKPVVTQRVWRALERGRVLARG